MCTSQAPSLHVLTCLRSSQTHLLGHLPHGLGRGRALRPQGAGAPPGGAQLRWAGLDMRVRCPEGGGVRKVSSPVIRKIGAFMAGGFPDSPCRWSRCPLLIGRRLCPKTQPWGVSVGLDLRGRDWASPSSELPPKGALEIIPKGLSPSPLGSARQGAWCMGGCHRVLGDTTVKGMAFGVR